MAEWTGAPIGAMGIGESPALGQNLLACLEARDKALAEASRSLLPQHRRHVLNQFAFSRLHRLGRDPVDDRAAIPTLVAARDGRDSLCRLQGRWLL